MSSLQEQLLKAGLVDQKKLDKAEQEKKRKSSAARKKQGKKAARPAPAKQTAQSKKVQRDRELNQKYQQERQRKEQAAQAQQLIRENKQDRSKGEHPFSFVYRGKVKKFYITEAQRDQLVAGKLAIVTIVTQEGRRFELVPGPIADKVRERDDSFLVDLDQPSDSKKDDDDPYADYQVPDDLIW